jgi:hypothetical protein
MGVSEIPPQPFTWSHSAAPQGWRRPTRLLRPHVTWARGITLNPRQGRVRPITDSLDPSENILTSPASMINYYARILPMGLYACGESEDTVKICASRGKILAQSGDVGPSYAIVKVIACRPHSYSAERVGRHAGATSSTGPSRRLSEGVASGNHLRRSS